MTPQEVKDLKNRPHAELEKIRKELREKLRGLTLDLAAGKVKNEAPLRVVKKDIARVETFLSALRNVPRTN
jgi:ribosomal protein L29